jgi:GNAT superfamily N-acetyltransferase
MTLEIRLATDDDLPGIVELAAAGLGWAAYERHAALFRWKHVDNAFGPSPLWVAVDGGRVVALRAFLRWEFTRDAAVVRAVRAVDTVTHPDYRGQGLFRRLTLEALDVLRDEGVAFVFNTPNDQSRPGYLGMGWVELGRLPLCVRPRSVTGLVRMLRARRPAELWSEPHDGGAPVATAAPATATATTGADGTAPSPLAYTTNRSPAYLSWRYGFEPLHYASTAVDGTTTYYRVHRRGPAREVVLCDAVGPAGTADAALAATARQAGGDYAVALARGPLRRGFVPLPNQGPVLTWRAVCDDRPPSRRDFDLSLGDVELF